MPLFNKSGNERWEVTCAEIWQIMADLNDFTVYGLKCHQCLQHEKIKGSKRLILCAPDFEEVQGRCDPLNCLAVLFPSINTVHKMNRNFLTWKPFYPTYNHFDRFNCPELQQERAATHISFTGVISEITTLM